MFEYGISEGLAYRHNFQQDIQNRHENAMLDMKARSEAEARAKLTGDLFNQGKAYDTYNQKILKEFSEKQITSMGKFMDENPDWQTSPMKYAKLKSMSNSLIDNPIILESATVLDAKNKMVEWAQKNPNSVNSPQYQAQVNAYDRYSKTGNAGADPRMRNSFMFVPPEPWKDINAEFVKYGNGIKDFDVEQLDPYTHGLGAWQSQPKKEELDAQIHAMYLDNKDQVDYQASKAGMDPYAYLLRGITPNITKQYQKGDFGALITMAKEKNAAAAADAAVSPYDTNVLKQSAGEFPQDFPEKAFGKTPPVATVFGTHPSDKIDWNGREVRWNNRFHDIVYQGKKVPAAEGTITISRDEAVDLGICSGAITRGFNQSGTDDIATGFKQFARVRQNEKGDWMVDVDVVKPFDKKTEIYRTIYDGPVPDKYQKAPGMTEEIGIKIVGGIPYRPNDDGTYTNLQTGAIISKGQ